MRNQPLAVLALFALAACGDPLAQVERLQDVPLAAGAASIAPGPADMAGAAPVLPALIAESFADAPPTGEAPAAEVTLSSANAPSELIEGAEVILASATAAPEPLPFGTLVPVCGLPESALGAKIAEASGYALHDSDPTSIAPRPQFLTGFADGCPRQMTGALAMFGDVGTHEAIRYQPSTDLPWSETDTAYETIRAEACGVPQGAPCGAPLDRLARRTTFLTVYAAFGTNPGWADILLHDGEVLAVSLREG